MRPQPISLVLAVLGCLLATTGARAQSHSLDDYALFATDQLRTRGMTVQAGDVGVNLGSLSASGVISASHSTVVANTAKLKPGSSCTALYAGVLTGAPCGPLTPFTGPVVEGDVAELCGFPNPFPSCDSAKRVTVAAGASQVLDPGSYGDVSVMGAGSSTGTLILRGGDYEFCSVRLGRGARMLFDSASQVFLQSDLRMAPLAKAEAAPGSGILPPAIRWFVNGTRVRPSRGATLDGKLCGPRATLGAGAGSMLDGSFVAKRIRTDRTDVGHTGFGPQPTTTTSTTTTSTTSPPSTSTTVTVTTTLPPCDGLCGNGAIDSRCQEECDGSARGALVGDACPICEECRCVTTTTIDCVVERRCGDGITQPECGEQCDVGSAESAFVSDACPSCVQCKCVTTSTTVVTTTTSTTIPGDCPQRCGNGTIDEACQEECDGSARGALVGTCDACVACRCVTTTTLPAVEICGNCIDDDHNGLTDFEDPACCSQTQAFAMELKRGRLVPRGSATKLRLRAFLARNGMDINPKAQDVELQISGKAGQILCAQIPASAFKQKKSTFKFKDPKHTVPGAAAIDRVVIRVKKNHTVTFRVKGRKVAVATPAAGSMRLTVGFRNPSTAEAANRCSSLRSAEFRTGPKGSIRFP